MIELRKIKIANRVARLFIKRVVTLNGHRPFTTISP